MCVRNVRVWTRKAVIGFTSETAAAFATSLPQPSKHKAQWVAHLSPCPPRPVIPPFYPTKL